MKAKERGILVHPEELTERWLVNMREAGLNVLGLHPVGGRQADQSLRDAVRDHGTEKTRGLLAKARDMGIAVEYEAHAMRYLLPADRYRAHPDWFRMDERGERVPDFNLCPSRPEALAFVAERAAALAEALDTGTDRFAFWLDDVAGRTCHCPACRGLSPSDQQLTVVNAMLAGLRRRDPRARLCYLAYHDTLEPPRRVAPAEGVFLEYAPFRRNPHRPLADPGCEENRRESRTLKDLLGFFGRKDAKVLEYWMDNSLYSNWTKPPRPFALDQEVMRRDVEYYLSLGFESLTSFGCYLGPDYQALYGEPPLELYGRILAEESGGRRL